MLVYPKPEGKNRRIIKPTPAAKTAEIAIATNAEGIPGPMSIN